MTIPATLYAATTLTLVESVRAHELREKTGYRSLRRSQHEQECDSCSLPHEQFKPEDGIEGNDKNNDIEGHTRAE